MNHCEAHRALCHPRHFLINLVIMMRNASLFVSHACAAFIATGRTTSGAQTVMPPKLLPAISATSHRKSKASHGHVVMGSCDHASFLIKRLKHYEIHFPHFVVSFFSAST